MIKIIDPHLHLFDLIKGDYQWLRPENPPFWPDKQLIAKSFTEQDLALTTPLMLAGFVHIEAGFDNQQPWREIAWLENTCQLPFRSIAMLDITLAPSLFTQQLDKLMCYKSVVGIRYILDDHALDILSDKNSQANLEILAANKLSFELQMSLSDTPALEQLLTIIASIPTLLICINHAGWPMPDNVQHSLWLKNLKRLAKFNHVFIKCSGYEMTDRAYSASWQNKVVSHCVAVFDVERVMLASNFPLSLFHSSYQDIWLANTELPFSAEQLQQLCFSNAQGFYQF
jgi:L-fuconolactonase